MNLDSPIGQLLLTTVRIQTKSSRGEGSGTGFLFNMPHGEHALFFIVTNKHVIAGADEMWVNFVQGEDGRPKLGDEVGLGLTNDLANWDGHPNANVDIAVRFFNPLLDEMARAQTMPAFRAMTPAHIPSDAQVDELEAVEDIYFIGYPSGHYDKKNLTPIVRQGITATPLQLDYGGDPIFLIDASVFPGSSGSPVVIANSGSYNTCHGLVVGSRSFFLGVVASVLCRVAEGTFRIVDIPTVAKPEVWTQEMIDLGVVYKSTTVLETVNHALALHLDGDRWNA